MYPSTSFESSTGEIATVKPDMMVSVLQRCEAQWLGAGEIASCYAARQLSPVELLESLLARIAALDPQLNVFTRLDADLAMDEARRAEREIAAGRHRGGLHGVPIGIKDIFD